MANQIHRLQVDGELHRPERSGFGNPNTLELTFVEDGQYFQDETTGSIYRYNGDSNEWELLVGYDRGTQRITNIGAQTVDGKIGELTASAGIAPPDSEEEGASVATGQQNIIVTQLTANLYVPVAAGDELKLISSEDQSVERYVTVVEGAESGGEVTIDIQDDLFRQYFPIGSHIILDGAQFEAKFSVDPTRITLKVNEERELSEFGTLVPPNGISTTIGENLDVGFEGPELEIASTNISADNPVRVVAGEKIQVYEPFIDAETRVQEFTVAQEGGGTFTSSPFVIPVEETSFTQVFTTRATVREPSFSTSSRVSVLSDEIVLKVDNNGNIASIKLSGSADDGSDITINADQITVAGQTTFLSSLESELDIPEDAVVIVSATQPLTRDNGDPLQSGDVWKNTSDNDLLYTYDGANWIRSFTQIDGGDIVTGTVTANKIDVDDLFSQSITVKGGGFIQSDGYNGSNGFQILSSGNAKFQDIQITGNSSSMSGGTISALTILGQLLMGSGGDITNTSGDFSITSSGVDIEAQGGNITGGARAINFKSGASTIALIGGVLAGTPGAPNELQLSSDLIVASGDSKTTGNNTVNGSSSLVGTVEIGNPAAPNIILNANGDAGFNGTISGDGSGLSNVVNSLTAGTGISLSGSTGNVTISATGAGGVDMTNGANNRIVTAVDSDSLNGEANLTYDGFDMKVIDSSIRFEDASGNGMRLDLAADDDFFMAPLTAGTADFTREFRWDFVNDRWQVDDDFYVGGVFSNPSDQRYKENVEPLQNSLDNLMQLQTIRYDMKDFLPDDQRKMLGVFAQEVEQFYPEAVTDGIIEDDEGNEHELKSVSYTQLVPVLIDAIKELKQQNEELKTRIEALEG